MVLTCYCDFIVIKSIEQIRRIVVQGLSHLFIISSSFHFFNETDFDQYLLTESQFNRNSAYNVTFVNCF